MATAPIETRSESTAVEIYQPDAQIGELKLWRAPEKVLAEAKQAADALQKVIDGSNIQPIKFGDKKHLLHEHWGILGHFYGYSTKIDMTEFVEFPDGDGGTIRGFKAIALLLVERTGAIVGRVESMCLDEEDSWGEVAEYEWRDKANGRGREKVEIGTKTKPLFQLQSMAETRASSKAYRMKLSWVAVLAGYSPTPAAEIHAASMAPKPAADELPTQLQRKPAAAEQSQPLQQRAVASPAAPSYLREAAARPQSRPAPAPQSARVISEAQARRFYALWREAGKTKAIVKEYLQNAFGIDNDRQIPANKYQSACEWAQGKF